MGSFPMVVVSIPHRYAENGIIGVQKGEYVVFQSLIGMLKTLVPERVTLLLVAVSIPHRYAENWSYLALPHMLVEGFNPS